MPIHTYTGWNVRNSAEDEQIEPYKKYIFICEGINTETFYFEKLIDLRKEYTTTIERVHGYEIGYDDLISLKDNTSKRR